MGGKKPVAKAKSKTKQAAAPEPEEPESAERLEAKRLWQQRRNATKWAQAQLDAVRAQLMAAQKKGNCDWLQVNHEFHEIKLLKVVKRLEAKTLDDVPQELKDGVEAYMAQCASGPVESKEGFREERGIWDLLPPEASEAGYARPEETPESTAVIERIRAWSDVSEAGVKELSGLMQAHGASAGVQEAGLTRLGWLFGEAAREGAASNALTAANVMPAIEAAMKGKLPDPEVQRSGCAALRGLAMADGELKFLCDLGGVELAVEAVRTHYKIKEVALSANGAFWAMAKGAGKNSPELSRLRSCGVIEALKKVMDHHAWDQTLVGKVRVTLPFITED